MDTTREMAVFPVPKCCGAAILVGFGFDSGPARYDRNMGTTTFETLKKHYRELIDGFKNNKGEFSPAHQFDDEYIAEASEGPAYTNGRRSFLQAYLTSYQYEDWRETMELDGWTVSASFRNAKSGKKVLLLTLVKDEG